MSAAIFATAVALAFAVVWLGTLVLPYGKAVKVRNAFLFRRGAAADFDWSPDRAPADFRIERAQPPEPIRRAVAESEAPAIEDDWQRALAIAGLLLRHAQESRPIRADLVSTFRGIVAGGGYCADYVRAYIAAAAAANLFCRQWAFSFDGFGGHGHTFVEIYDRGDGRWKFLDIHNNVFAARRGEHAPLSALQLRAALVAQPEEVEFRPATAGRLGWPHPEKLRAYYLRGVSEWYLWWGNDVVSRERRGASAALSLLSGTLAHRTGSALGNLPKIRALVTGENLASVKAIESLRWRVALALALVLSLSVAIVSLWAARPSALHG